MKNILNQIFYYRFNKAFSKNIIKSPYWVKSLGNIHIIHILVLIKRPEHILRSLRSNITLYDHGDQRIRCEFLIFQSQYFFNNIKSASKTD